MWILSFDSRKKGETMISPVYRWIAEKTELKEKLSSETLKKWQQEKLNIQLQYVKENSRFYNKYLPDTNILNELPFTTMGDIANDPYNFLAIPQNKVARITTLPAPGLPDSKKRIFFSENDIEKVIEFFSVGMSVMVESGEKAQILISSNSPNSLGTLLKESLARLGVSAEITAPILSVQQAIEDSKEKNCLIGMPSEILYMSKINKSLRPRSVLLTADYVSDSIIKSIKEIWQCNVYTHYGHTELGFGYSVDCDSHNGLHTRDADFILEIISPVTGQAVAEKESGEIVLTSLTAEAMPLIRYRTGEIAKFINQPCGCGASLPRIKKIEGRFDNLLRFADGKILSIHMLDELLFAETFVRGFNAKLVDKKTLLLIIDSEEEINTEKFADKLPAELKLEIKYETINPFQNRNKRKIIIE